MARKDLEVCVVKGRLTFVPLYSSFCLFCLTLLCSQPLVWVRSNLFPACDVVSCALCVRNQRTVTCDLSQMVFGFSGLETD